MKQLQMSAVVSMGVALMRRPDLWRITVVLVKRMAAPGWYRRFPFLPIPPEEYLEFRLHTAYGTDGQPTGADLVTYLEWAKRYPHN